MNTTQPDAQLSDLIGSRICHDLISPLGAISNGLELLSMSGLAGSTPELEMIADSVQNANARVKFFRVAFGAAKPGQMTSGREIRQILAELAPGGRCQIDWQVEGDCERQMVKLAFLLIMCAETALPRGGTIVISNAGATWNLTASSDTIALDGDLWGQLSGNTIADQVMPAQVQFMLAPMTAAAMARNLEFSQSDGQVSVRF